MRQKSYPICAVRRSNQAKEKDGVPQRAVLFERQQFQLIVTGLASSGTAAARRESLRASNSVPANASYSAEEADRPRRSYAAAAAP